MYCIEYTHSEITTRNLFGNTGIPPHTSDAILWRSARHGAISGAWAGARSPLGLGPRLARGHAARREEKERVSGAFDSEPLATRSMLVRIVGQTSTNRSRPSVANAHAGHCWREHGRSWRLGVIAASAALRTEGWAATPLTCSATWSKRGGATPSQAAVRRAAREACSQPP